MLSKYNLVVKLFKNFHFDLEPKKFKSFLWIITSLPTSQNKKQQPFLGRLNMWTLENLSNDKVGRIKAPSHNTAPNNTFFYLGNVIYFNTKCCPQGSIIVSCLFQKPRLQFNIGHMH
jgi:hypothetical protein